MGKRRHRKGQWGSNDGWNLAVQEQISNIQLPDAIECALCSQTREIHAYSVNQLNKLRLSIYKDGPEMILDQHVARCMTCTLHAVTELTCKTCGEIKALDEFATTQRQFAEPVCMLCQDWLQQDERDKRANDHLISQMEAAKPFLIEGEDPYTALTLGGGFIQTGYETSEDEQEEENTSVDDQPRGFRSGKKPSTWFKTPRDERNLNLMPIDFTEHNVGKLYGQKSCKSSSDQQ
ncbi:hypothetical protein N7462_003105 [Penicillium macrosclerotiorum]|uniref:uncharacterized protein n=1 Tax=Penicillium macrosclerotiorum TaxID=303699 RepID=UPI0025476912|nr:uncharacterized protein N7462_003105 [Penicillium macrosclerotiorum]KAJ5688713.1 hypothetical protein N7462_003105 [Penicillium macrosclerotiorum]